MTTFKKWKLIKEEFEINKEDFYDKQTINGLLHIIIRDKEDNWANIYFDKKNKNVSINIIYNDNTYFNRLDKY